MYKEAYDLIIEILSDEQLNKFVKATTGKRLAIIDSGPQVTVPAAVIILVGGEISNSDNAMQHVIYSVSFALPYWNAKGMRRCHEFLDVAIEAFFAHTLGRNYVQNITPVIMEDDPEERLWTVSLHVQIPVFLY